MGVPKFYRWISERYPCLSEVVKEFQIPEFDNLYLDMNGIIHVCSHPDDNNPHFRITEEKIFADIFHYIEFLFRMIKPRKVFFMAVDGVAPRAKMNQQRGRRFRSAREAENLIKEAEAKGEKLPTEKRFDSNCITPGTEFMVRLQEQLQQFVATKVSSDPLWQGPEVFLSGHETPGEGEHKIMEYIRYAKSQPDYDNNTRHCLYGLDADLIMLGLVSHEPHFSLLREEVRFGGKKDRNKRPPTPEETTFHLLHLSLLREYIDYEFRGVQGRLKFEYNMENIIDDWILMGFLVGNDFIPHLPLLHIHHDALPLLWQTYRDVLPTLDGYLNTGGHLHLDRFEKYLNALSKFDTDTFANEYVDLKYWEGKTGKKKTISSGLTNADRRKNKGKSSKNQLPGNQFSALVDSNLEPKDDMEDGEDDEDVYQTPDEDLTETEDDGDLMDWEFKKHKDDYYRNKLAYDDVTKEVMEEQAEGYVLAIQWILLYYFEGVPSWSWYYPHHYAPYISDVKNFSHMQIQFQLGRPFLPFQQLMAVLPAASKELLPPAYRDLMTEESSPVIDFYPVDFQSDLNGKQQEWEAVVLIPFIEEKRLLAAMGTKEGRLTAAERARNRHGPCIVYQYTPEMQPPLPSTLPTLLPDLNANYARRREILLDGFDVASDKLVKGLLPGVMLDVHFPGFPTFKHIQHSTYLKKAGVKVFQMNSRGESMMLKITLDGAKETLDAVATRLLGNTTFVGWPHLQEAQVVAVSDGVKRIELEEGAAPKKSSRTSVPRVVKTLTDGDAMQFQGEVTSIKQRYHDRLAVEVGQTDILLYCCTMTGRRYVCGSHSQITLEKQFSTLPAPYALQVTVKDIASFDPGFSQFRTLDELFPKGSPVFMLGLPHYGCQGSVLEVDQERARVRVAFSVPEEPCLSDAVGHGGVGPTRYMPGHVLAQRLGVSTHFVSRITGTIYILRRTNTGGQAKINIGLNMKFTKRKQELPGYTKRTDDGWSYSEKAQETIGLYLQRFPQVAETMTKLGTQGDMFAAEDIFPQNVEENLAKLQEFLQGLPCSSVTPMDVGSDILDESEVQCIEQAVNQLKQDGKLKKQIVKILVKPSLLFRPVLYSGPLIPDPEARFMLYDRVVSVKPAFGVPMGMRGTVIGVHPAPKEVDIIYDVVFDEEFIGGITLRCSSKHGYRVPAPALINLTHGQRKEQGKLPQQSTPRAAWPPKQASPQKKLYPRPDAKVSYSILKGSAQLAANSYSSFQGTLQQPFILMPQGNASNATSNSYSRAASSQQTQAQRQLPQSMLQHDDFANIWKQLQNAPESRASNRSCSPSMSAAMEAALKITPPVYFNEELLDTPTPPQADTPDDEFLAAFQRLEASSSPADSRAESADTSLNSNTNANTSSQDSSLQLKQMLKIGDAGTNGPSVPLPGAPSSPQPSRNYGRQLSVQELFDVAKQSQAGEGSQPLSLSTTAMLPSTQGASQPPKASLSQSSSQGQQQVGGRSQPPTTTSWAPGPGYQPLLSTPRNPSVSPRPPASTGPQHRGPMPPPQGNVSRNPVNELKALAQRHQLGDVTYKYYRTKGLYTASVILSNGARFEGTACATREEAAESAASTALLLMNPNSQAPLLGMPMGMPGQGPFFSQGSAFSPVRPRGMPPHLLPQPRGFGPRQQPFRPGFPPFLGGPGPGPRGMGMPPPPMGGFPPNAHFPPGPGQRPPGQFGGPYMPQRNQGPQLRQQGQQGPWPGQPFSQQRMPQQQQQQGGPANQSQKKGPEPSFIPLQVQRKQKLATHKKTDTVEGNGMEHPPVEPPVDTPAEGLLIDLSEPEPQPAKPQAPSQAFGAMPDPSSLPSPQAEASPSPQPGVGPKKPSKRRSRVAANFSNAS